MWSLGCILAELYTGYPLFPGENEQEQLACIMEIQGVPERYLIERSTRRKVFFDSNGNPKLVINSKGKKRRPGSKTLGQVLKCTDLLFLDFIAKCLIWDPERRMKPYEALRHDWILEGKSSSKTGSSSSATTIVDGGSTSRRKSSVHSNHSSGHSSRKAKSDYGDSMTLNNGSQVSLKSNRSTVADNASNANGSFAYYSQPIPSFNSGGGGGGSNGVAGVNSGNTNHIAKMYGGQVQPQLPQQPPLFLQQHYHQQQPQQQQQAYGGVYGTSSTSSVASRRLTAGDIASSAYQHGSRKNATSMFMAG
ncbi:hypothetical protein BGX34_009372 [Mortierella sp. NVP85]|nr:hypothetical protein BGX34_009372 [Mortierella sp. NVP85]